MVDKLIAAIETEVHGLDTVTMTIRDLLAQFANKRTRNVVLTKANQLGCPEDSKGWTIGPLLGVTLDEWLTVRNCGMTVLNEIRTVLGPLGANCN